MALQFAILVYTIAMTLANLSVAASMMNAGCSSCKMRRGNVPGVVLWHDFKLISFAPESRPFASSLEK